MTTRSAEKGIPVPFSARSGYEREAAQTPLAALEKRREVLARYGKQRITVPFPQTGTLPELGRTFGFELEPVRSLKTGAELAAQVERDEIKPVRDQIEQLEREAQTLLGRRNRR